MNAWKAIERGHDRVVHLSNRLSEILIVFVVIIVSAEVFLRYFFKSYFPYELELTEYSLVFITYLAMAQVLRKDGHVSLDVLLSRVSSRVRSNLELFDLIVVTILCVLLTVLGLWVAWGYYKIHFVFAGDLPIPAFLLFMVIPISFFLTAIQGVRNIIARLRKTKKQSLEDLGDKL
jgi:C4-dicarboxylate transporter, DctQ subunit